MSQSQNVPINVDELLKRCLGQIEFAQEILDDYLETCGRGIDNLKMLSEYCEDSEKLEQLRSEAHRLKGTSATVAATELEQLFESIESCIRAGNPEQAFQQVPSIEEAFEHARQFVSSGLPNTVD